MNLADLSIDEVTVMNDMLDDLREAKVGTYFVTEDEVYVRKTPGAMWAMHTYRAMDIPRTNMDLVSRYWKQPWSLS